MNPDLEAAVQAALKPIADTMPAACGGSNWTPSQDARVVEKLSGFRQLSGSAYHARDGTALIGDREAPVVDVREAGGGSGSSAGAGGGDTHNHYHAHVTTMDSRDVSRWFRGNGKAVFQGMGAARSNGAGLGIKGT